MGSTQPILPMICLIICCITVLYTHRSAGQKLLWACDFSRMYLCGAQNVTSQTYFHFGHGETPSEGTGPSGDHTLERIRLQQQYYPFSEYIYLEASWARLEDRAIMRLPYIYISEDSCLTFYYHMYSSNGRDQGNLRVVVSTDAVTVWFVYGNKGKRWHQGEINLRPYAVNIQFIAARGGGIQSDIAIDDILIKTGSCYGIPPTLDPPTPPPQPVFVPFPTQSPQPTPERPPIPVDPDPNRPPIPTIESDPDRPPIPTIEPDNDRPPIPTVEDPNRPPIPTIEPDPDRPPIPTVEDPYQSPIPTIESDPDRPPIPTVEDPNRPPIPTVEDPNRPPIPTVETDPQPAPVSTPEPVSSLEPDPPSSPFPRLEPDSTLSPEPTFEPPPPPIPPLEPVPTPPPFSPPEPFPSDTPLLTLEPPGNPPPLPSTLQPPGSRFPSHQETIQSQTPIQPEPEQKSDLTTPTTSQTSTTDQNGGPCDSRYQYCPTPTAETLAWEISPRNPVPTPDPSPMVARSTFDWDSVNRNNMGLVITESSNSHWSEAPEDGQPMTTKRWLALRGGNGYGTSSVTSKFLQTMAGEGCLVYKAMLSGNSALTVFLRQQGVSRAYSVHSHMGYPRHLGTIKLPVHHFVLTNVGFYVSFKGEVRQPADFINIDDITLYNGPCSP